MDRMSNLRYGIDQGLGVVFTKDAVEVDFRALRLRITKRHIAKDLE